MVRRVRAIMHSSFFIPLCTFFLKSEKTNTKGKWIKTSANNTIAFFFDYYKNKHHTGRWKTCVHMCQTERTCNGTFLTSPVSVKHDFNLIEKWKFWVFLFLQGKRRMIAEQTACLLPLWIPPIGGFAAVFRVITLWSSPLVDRNLDIELLHQDTHDVVTLAVNFKRS